MTIASDCYCCIANTQSNLQLNPDATIYKMCQSISQLQTEFQSFDFHTTGIYFSFTIQADPDMK